MKKKLLTLAVALLAATGAWAQTTFTAENLKYTVTDETTHTVELTGYVTKPEGALTIPATVTNESTEYSVTSIGSMAFRSCSSLTAVTIPASVTKIGSWAFSLCSQLTAVTIPEGVATIGSYAFGYCHSLTAVNIPASVTSIGEWSFDEYTALTQINVASGNTAYCSENGILFNKDKTTLICYPAGKPQLEYTIPSSVTVMTVIGVKAFAYCDALTQLTIPEGVATIGNSAFKSCSSLTEVNIPASVTNIGSWVFNYCSALTAIHVAEGNTAYSSEDGVLFNKDKTTLLQYPAGKTETTYAVPASVTSIAEYAFAWCRNLTKISLPESLDNIGNVAFNECTNLTEMTVLATTPPTLGTGAFQNVSRTIPVYVPATSLATYQAAEVWSEFTNLQAIGTTGLQTPAMPESIRIYNGTLHNPQGLHLTLYDMQGRQVYSGTDATLSQPAGVYVVRCNGASGKVVF